MEINGNWVGRNLHDEIPGLNPPAWPQLIQRRGESAEPRKHVLGDRGVHVVDTMAYAQLQISSRVALTPKRWTGRYEVPVYGAEPDTP